ncbi:CD276 antigen-like [Erpetoichthys calabaricus]|uniref:CD276 antigen-like n=1 Tax=Erpetoichthys calabaricus TaxID=27687 RepID=UPI002234414B|nr:CD276 antigen-like [Erpetoichthys calabaricus]
MGVRYLHIPLLMILHVAHVFPEDIYQEAGNDVVLPCYFPLSKFEKSTKIIIWQKLPETIVYSSNERDPVDGQYINRAVLSRTSSPNASLRLHNINEADEGTYKCFLDQTTLSHEVKLTVKEPITTTESTARKQDLVAPGNSSVKIILENRLALSIFVLFLLQYLG